MANNYTPPGVTVSEKTDRAVTPGLAPAGIVAIVGESQGRVYQTYSKTLTPGTALALTKKELPHDSTDHKLTSAKIIVDQKTIEFEDPNNVGELVLDATTINTGTTVYDVHATLNVDSLSTTGGTIRISGNDLGTDTYKVTFVISYIPADYFNPKEIRDYATAEALYGKAFDPEALDVDSELSAGIKLAFANGARQIIALPKNQTESWATALDRLLASEDISIIVPVFKGLAVSDQNLAFNAIQEFQQTSNDDYQRLIFAVFGQEALTRDAENVAEDLASQAEVLRAFANGQYANQCALVSPAKFDRKEDSSHTYTLGGQFLAAAIAGQLAGRNPSQSITRQNVVGVSKVDFRSRIDQNADAANGLLVVEQLRNAVQVRHGITVSEGAVYETEIAVVRAKNRMIASIQSTLETQVIGQTYADDLATTIVSGAVVGILQLLKSAGELVDFSDVQARLLELDPTTMDVRFSYKPSFPLNYINVGFSINLSNATATVTQ